MLVKSALEYTMSILDKTNALHHDDVIKWKHFPRYWPFVRGIHRSPVNSPHKAQWRGALMLSLICAWINDWVNAREAGDLRRHCTHYDVIVMMTEAAYAMDWNRDKVILEANRKWIYSELVFLVQFCAMMIIVSIIKSSNYHIRESRDYVYGIWELKSTK